MPLILTQLNTIFMWTCLGCDQMGVFRLVLSDQQQIIGTTYREFAINSLLAFAIYLDPVNVFLYTWQFLTTLEVEESNPILSRMYRWYRKISIWILPASLIVIFVAIVITYGIFVQYLYDGNTN